MEPGGGARPDAGAEHPIAGPRGGSGPAYSDGRGYYSIHPALPWFFRRLFEERDAEARSRALRAYVEAIGFGGEYYWGQYAQGNRDVVGALRAEESNLLHARALARRNGWWRCVLGTMQGLRTFYDHTGRRAEWARLVEEIVPDFVDPATEGPLPGREENWSLVTGYRVGLLEEARQWAEAERLQEIHVEWDRGRARDDDRNSQRTLAASLHGLGQIQREIGRTECVAAYRESFDLAQRIGDGTAAAASACNLGNAYIGLRDLAEAERWYRGGLELMPDGDRMGRAGSLGQLGHVARERFEEARRANQPEAVLLRHLNDALGFYQQALAMTPPDAIGQLAVIHNQLGASYGDAGQLDRALRHYRESIRYRESAGNLYGAALTQYNVAVALLRARRLADARDYADAALRNYQTYGASAEQDIQDTLGLIAAIDKAASEGSPAQP